MGRVRLLWRGSFELRRRWGYPDEQKFGRRIRGTVLQFCILIALLKDTHEEVKDEKAIAIAMFSYEQPPRPFPVVSLSRPQNASCHSLKRHVSAHNQIFPSKHRTATTSPSLFYSSFLLTYCETLPYSPRSYAVTTLNACVLILYLTSAPPAGAPSSGLNTTVSLNPLTSLLSPYLTVPLTARDTTGFPPAASAILCAS